ncbi:MAG: helix-turn-helix transcriptional regulator, partial [Desulfatibacillaceae bacterium]|nr:helix-turn-helix transcriptional regulator [Desulfatibacillaceae bacterium]
EILLGFWKVHILYHAAKGRVIGMEMIQELKRHGYDISPGTLYPLLARLNKMGWLECKQDKLAGPKAKKEYVLTALGQEVLDFLKGQIEELYREVVLDRE